MARHIMKSRKGISPVIATVILVAVAITVSVSVAYWMGGISSLYTRLEKIEIQSIVATKGVAGNYTITLAAKNTGSADATIVSSYHLDKGMVHAVKAMCVGDLVTEDNGPIIIVSPMKMDPIVFAPGGVEYGR